MRFLILLFFALLVNLGAQTGLDSPDSPQTAQDLVQDSAQDSPAVPKNYALFAQIGAIYSQNYGNYAHDAADSLERKVDFSNLFAAVGFEGREFGFLRFGANALGTIKLSGGKSATGADIFRDNLAKDALLYQLFLGAESEFFGVSAGRELIDLEWVSDFVEGARIAAKIPPINGTQVLDLSAYYFKRQAIADPNEVVAFEDNDIGATFAILAQNRSLDFLALDAYFLSGEIFRVGGVGAALSLGNEENLASNTSAKYAFFGAKNAEFGSAQYLQLEEALNLRRESFGLEWGLNFAAGGIKMLNQNARATLDIAALGDQNPLEIGDLAYAKNALTLYLGAGVSLNDWLNFTLVYANTSGAKDDAGANLGAQNELDLGLLVNLFGAELGLTYSKIFGAANLGAKPANREYFEMVVAYNF